MAECPNLNGLVSELGQYPNSTPFRYPARTGSTLKRHRTSRSSKAPYRRAKTAIGEALANGEVRIAGFGTFGARSRPARTGRNPRTGESLSIPASTAPVFKPGKGLTDAVNDGKAS